MVRMTIRCKTCSRCDQSKPLTDFRWRKTTQAYTATCRQCLNERQRDRWKSDQEWRNRKTAQIAKWRERNPEAHARNVRSSGLRRRYGITIEEYDALFVTQSGLCSICAGESERWLVIDHDHNTGQVRGLLCWQCNGALGILGEDNLKRALDYLAGATIDRLPDH